MTYCYIIKERVYIHMHLTVIALITCLWGTGFTLHCVTSKKIVSR